MAALAAVRARALQNVPHEGACACRRGQWRVAAVIAPVAAADHDGPSAAVVPVVCVGSPVIEGIGANLASDSSAGRRAEPAKKLRN